MVCGIESLALFENFLRATPDLLTHNLHLGDSLMVSMLNSEKILSKRQGVGKGNQNRKKKIQEDVVSHRPLKESV